MALLESCIAQPPPRELENGAVRFEGTRVSLDSVIYCFNQGYTAEDVVRSFTTLILRDVYFMIAYYLDNREAVDAYIQWQEVKAKDIRGPILCPRRRGFALLKHGGSAPCACLCQCFLYISKNSSNNEWQNSVVFLPIELLRLFTPRLMPGGCIIDSHVRFRFSQV